MAAMKTGKLVRITQSYSIINFHRVFFDSSPEPEAIAAADWEEPKPKQSKLDLSETGNYRNCLGVGARNRFHHGFTTIRSPSENGAF